MISVLNTRNYKVMDIFSLLLALAVWQFTFDGPMMIMVLIGLVVPSMLVVWGRWSEKDEVAASLSLFVILFALLNGPLGFENIGGLILRILVGALVVFLFKPVTSEFITGVLASFWFHFCIGFVFGYIDGWKEMFSATLLEDIASYAYGVEGVASLAASSWWIYIESGFLLSLLTKMIYSPQTNNRFMTIGGLLTFPFLGPLFIAGGILYGTYTSIRIFLSQVDWNVSNEVDAIEENEQPGERIYVFHKGFIDWKTSFKESIRENVDSAKLFFAKIKNHQKYYGLSTFFYSTIFWGCASGVVFAVGGLWIIVASTLHLLVIVLGGLPLYLLWALLWAMDKGYRKVNRVNMLCPSCHHSSELPVYVCSNCSAEHSNLIPSAYGIFRRMCTCGEKLPTAFFNGRLQLKAICPSCKTHQHSRESTPISIPIIGGPSVGKTCFMISATSGIIKNVAPKQDWGVRFINEADQNQFEEASSHLLRGSLPAKTVNGPLSAFNFFITHKKWSRDKMVYFYDPAGESFNEMNNLKGHTYHGNNHGNIFMIDPFSIPGISQQFESHHDYYSKVNPSESSLEEIFDRLMIYFQEQYGIKPHQKIEKPIAFVINKVDAYDLNQRIGEVAAKELLEKMPSIKTMEEAIHQLCNQLLQEAGMNHFLRKIENKFSNYQFFASSSLKGNEYTNVEKPILWVLSQADKDLKIS
ncbi:MAG: TRAFAC clade GTPase domain-containing protein [Bacillota bacterium]